jgi:hypothetical protein
LDPRLLDQTLTTNDQEQFPDTHFNTPTYSITSSSLSTQSFDCPVCQQCFAKQYELKYVKCISKVGKTLTSIDSRHGQKHTPGKRCDYHGCGYRTYLTRDLEKHKEEVHLPPQHRCPVDGCKRNAEPFGREDNMKRHLKTQHKR